MHNLQANALSQLMLRSMNPKLYLVAFEPLMIKKNELKILSQGNLILLGKKLPKLYIYRKGGIVGQAKIGMSQGTEVVIISAKERIDNLGKAISKYILLTSRIAIIPKDSFVVGKLVPLPTNSFNNILLFIKQELVGSASLVQTKEGYALQLNEIY